MEQETKKSPVVPPLLVVLGGALIVVASFLQWGHVTLSTGRTLGTVKGGTLVVIAGLVVAALGVALWILPGGIAKFVIAIIAVVAGVLAIFAGIGGSAKEQIRNTIADKDAETHGASHQFAEQIYKRAEEQGTITTSSDYGGWVAVGGGVVAVIGGGIAIATSRRRYRVSGPLPEDLAPPILEPPSSPGATSEQPVDRTSSTLEGSPSVAAPPPPPAEPVHMEEESPPTESAPSEADSTGPPPEPSTES